MQNEYFRRYRSLLFSFLAACFLFIHNASAQDGESLFKANCTSCHAVKEKVIGPPLAGIETRRQEEWILKWVKNSQTVVKSGDEYAVKLFNDYNHVMMPPQNLKDPEIKAILAYIKTEAEKVETPTAAAQPGAPAEEKGDNTLVYLFIAAVLLLLIVGVLRRVQHILARTVRQKEGLPEPPVRSRCRQTP